MNPLHNTSWPGESREYRVARDELLEQEIDLRRRTEAVAEKRRQLPRGGEIKSDYIFTEGGPNIDDDTTAHEIRFSELFAPGKSTVVAYSFMYGPEAKAPCPMCVSLLDSLNGQAPHLIDNINLVVIAKSGIERLREWARERNWNNLRLLSSHDNTYNIDYRTENENGNQLPAIHVFQKDEDGRVYHFYNSELFFVNSEPGQHPRHVDSIWPLWNILDFTPSGRPDGWMPKLNYPSQSQITETINR